MSLLTQPRAAFELAMGTTTGTTTWSPVPEAISGSKSLAGATVDTSPLTSIVTGWIEAVAPAPVQLRVKGELLPPNEHPFLRLINAPNPVYGAVNLQGFLYRHLVNKGDGMARKIRDEAGTIIGLVPLPTDRVRLETARGGYLRPDEPVEPGDLIYRVGGDDYTAHDILHIRHGIDPRTMSRGESPFKNMLTHIASDAKAAAMMQSLMEKEAFVQLIFTLEDENKVLNLDEARGQLQRWVNDKFTGVNAGGFGIHALGTAIKPIELGRSPADLLVPETHRLSESRVAGAARVPAVVAGLQSGMETATRNQIQTQRQLAFENGVEPLQWRFGDALLNQVLVEFIDDVSTLVDYEVVMDNSRHSFLQEELLAQAERRLIDAQMVTELVTGFVLRPEEARAWLVEHGHEGFAGLTGPAPQFPPRQEGGGDGDSPAERRRTRRREQGRPGQEERERQRRAGADLA